MMIGDLARRVGRLPDLDTLGPVVAERLMREATARRAVRMYKTSASAVRKPSRPENGIGVYRDAMGRFSFTAAVAACGASKGMAPSWQLLRFVVDSGASQTYVPRWVLRGMGAPSGSSRVADGRSVPTEAASVHFYHHRLSGLLTFDALAFIDGGESDYGLIGMDALSNFDFADPFKASIVLRSPGVKTCSCD